MNYVCKNCSSSNMKVGKPKSPHLASLICGDCQRWQKFLGKAEILAIGYQQYEQALERNREDIEQLKLW